MGADQSASSIARQNPFSIPNGFWSRNRMTSRVSVSLRSARCRWTAMFCCIAIQAIHAAKIVPAAPTNGPTTDRDSTGAQRRIPYMAPTTAMAKTATTTNPCNKTRFARIFSSLDFKAAIVRLSRSVCFVPIAVIAWISDLGCRSCSPTRCSCRPSASKAPAS
jgi:hypothetical protein